MDQLKAFLEKVKSDENLMAKFDELGEKVKEDEVITLASEYGFTVTKEDIENAKNRTSTSGELKEEELEEVAGGAASKNRFFHNRCMNHGRTMLECVGILDLLWCDHYSRIHTGYNGISVKLFDHKCAMGAFDYVGYENGNPFYT